MPLRCLFLVQGLDAPATRYRVLQFLEFLPPGGIEPEVRAWPRSVFAWHRTVREVVAPGDVVVVDGRTGAVEVLDHPAGSAIR